MRRSLYARGSANTGRFRVDGARVLAYVRYPDGGTSIVGLAPRGEGVYDGEFTASATGVYTIRIHAEGRTLRGFPFTREAVRTAAVWQGGDAPPPTGHDDGWCAVVRCLLETKAIDLEVLKRYGIHPDRLLKCCETVERIPSKRSLEVLTRKTFTK